MDIDRYPTWVLLLVATVSAAGLVVRQLRLHRGAGPRRFWLITLAAWLSAIGLAATGSLASGNGKGFTPNGGLLLLTDLAVGLLAVSVRPRRATRRPADGAPWLLQVPVWYLGLRRTLRRAITIVAIFSLTVAALMWAEISLAAALPAPPAVAACRDYAAWILAPANNSMPPAADVGVLTRASRVAPPGQLRADLRRLLTDVQSAISGSGSPLGAVADGRLVNSEGAVNADCKAVPVSG